MKQKYRVTAVLVSTALAAAALTGCTAGSDSGDVLRIGVTAAIDTLNPFVSISDYSAVVFQYSYPHMTEYDAKLQLVPSFAKSWDSSTDATTWTFHTVPNAKWSDGKAMNAKDAVFTLNTIMKYKDGPAAQIAGTVNHLISAEAPDDNTLVLTYDAPEANVLSQMQGFDILPEHVWSKYATGDGKGLQQFQNGAPMVSGGPFMLTQYKKDQLALFTDNPNWWGAKPKIHGFGLQMFANGDAMISAFKAGQIDMIGESTPATTVDSLTKAGMVVSNEPGNGFYDLIINSSSNKTTHVELQNPSVREALEYATDREQMIKTAWLGHAEAGGSIIASAAPFHDPSIKGLPYDLTKANTLLDGLGFTKGADGIRVANGSPMTYKVIFPTEINGAGDRMFQILQVSYASIGIKLEMSKMDSDAATAAINGSDGKYADFDLAMWNWIPPISPEFMLGVVTCAQLGNNSDSGYCNADYDQMFSDQGTLTDPVARQAKISEMQQKIFNDRPYIVLVYQNVLEAHSPQWEGFIMSPHVGSVNNLSTQTLLQVHKVK